jgi:hypothetical protein
MVHPFSETSIDIKANLEFCTTYKGIPYGPAFIKYKDSKENSLSFKGIGMFNEGKLHMTPFIYIDGDGYKC